MNKTILITIVFFLLQSVFANDYVVPTNENYEEDVVAVMVSVREIIEKNLDGEKGISLAAKILTDLDKNRGNKIEIVEIRKSAKKAVSKMRSNSMISQERQERFINGLDTNEFSPFAIDMLKNFLKPTVTCNTVEVGGGVAIIRAVAVGVGLGDCVGSNGRRWVRNFVGVGVGDGGGVTVDGSIGTCEASEYATDRLTTINSLKASLASVLGFAIERQEDRGRIRDGNLDVNLIGPLKIGLAAGAGAYVVEMKNLNIKMFYLGTDEEYLFDKFQNFK